MCWDLRMYHVRYCILCTFFWYDWLHYNTQRRLTDYTSFATPAVCNHHYLFQFSCAQQLHYRDFPKFCHPERRNVTTMMNHLPVRSFRPFIMKLYSASTQSLNFSLLSTHHPTTHDSASARVGNHVFRGAETITANLSLGMNNQTRVL